MMLHPNLHSTSPSIYVVISTISAVETVSHSLDEIEAKIYPDVHSFRVGAVHYSLTQAYPPNVLRTFPAACYHAFEGPHHVLDVEDLVHPPQNWITGQQCEVVMGEVPGFGDAEYPNPNGTEMAAFSNLLFPSAISNIDTAWSRCSQNTYYYPAWDPPRGLTRAVAMAPSTTDPVGFPAITQSAGGLPGADAGANWEHGDPSRTPDDPYTSSVKNVQKGTYIIEAPPSSLIVVGYYTLYALPNAMLSVDGMVVSAGASAIIVDGLAVSQDNSAIYVAGSSYTSYSSAVGPSPSPPPVGGHEVEGEPDGMIGIGLSTIAPGSQGTIAGTPISVNALQVIVFSSTYAKPLISSIDGDSLEHTGDSQNTENEADAAPADTPATPVITLPPLIGNQKVSRLADGAILVGGSTMPVGAQATFSNTYISVGSGVVIAGGTTFGLAIPKPTGASLVINGQRLWRVSNGDVVIGSVTLSQGSQTTISGTPISVGTKFVAVDGSSFELALPKPTDSAPLIGGQCISKGSNGEVVVGSLTLSQGSQTKIAGTAVSVGSNGIMIDGTPYQLPSAVESPVYINGQAFQRLPGGDVVIDTQTLSVNAVTTVSGLPISVGAKDVVVAETTHNLDPMPSTASIGAIIASMFGFVPLPPSSSLSTPETANSSNSTSATGSGFLLGGAASLDVNVWFLSLGVVCGVAVSVSIHNK
ncbi:hypothetical protein BDR22DRAFT_922317 [Usnea florida]